MKRLTITISGKSGSGLLSSGEILLKAFKNSGYYIHAERDFPSLIKGGYSRFQINLSTRAIHSLSEKTDILLALDKQGIENYFKDIKKEGTLIHAYDKTEGLKNIKKELEEKKIKIFELKGRELAKKLGGNELMVNMIILGMLWKYLDLDLNILETEVKNKFASKPKLLEIDLKCIRQGYKNIISNFQFPISNKLKTPNSNLLIDGNTAIALGAIHAGVRAYYAYPMSPASSILTYIAKTSHETGIVVKQAEDEITAIQMTIGSMFMGTRAFTATSGGGYDLMTESISLAGMIECPLVTVIVQRPGPATGLPTWTAQSDLNLAIHSSHGEFPRVVIACSDPTSCFELIQEAFNIAETYQIPVIVLSEKTIAEAKTLINNFELNKIKITRNIVENKEELKKLKSTDRFKLTKNGVSKRWLPGSSETIYFANGDEHKEDGTITEDAKESKEIMEKRMRKLTTILENIKAPQIYGEEKADISFIGFGSTKNVMIDIIEEYKEKNIKVNYLHYDYIWPLHTKKTREFFQNNKNVNLIEGNFTGQLGQLIEGQISYKFKNKFLKYNGRPFYFEEVIRFIEDNINK